MHFKKIFTVSVVVMQITLFMPVSAEKHGSLRPSIRSVSNKDKIDYLVNRASVSAERQAATNEEIKDFSKNIKISAEEIMNQRANKIENFFKDEGIKTNISIDSNRGSMIIFFPESGESIISTNSKTTLLDKDNNIIAIVHEGLESGMIKVFPYFFWGGIATGVSAKALIYFRNVKSAGSAAMVTTRIWNPVKGGYDTAKVLSTASKAVPRAASVGGAVGTSRLIPGIGWIITSGFTGSYIGAELRASQNRAEAEKLFKQSLTKDIEDLRQLEDCKVFTSSDECRGVNTSDARRDFLLKNISNNYSRLHVSQYPYIFKRNSIIGETNLFRNDDAYIKELLYNQSGDFMYNKKNIDKILNPVNPSRN